MIRKPLELPPAVARAFLKDMRASFAEENRYKQDEIALRQLHALKEHQGPALTLRPYPRAETAPAVRRERDVPADEGACQLKETAN
jgi:hypothetical protein